MSWSCPFHSFQLPLHVPDIFSVCPCHFPCMSRSFVASHFPTSPVVPIGFIANCFHFCPCHVPFVSLSFCYGLAGCLGWLFGFLCLVAVSGFFTFNFWNFAVLVRLGRSCWLGCASPKPALASFACDIFACLRPTSCLIMSLDLLTPTPAAASNT